MPRLLVPGGKGQVGTFTARHAGSFGFDVFAPDLGEIDITDPSSISAVFNDFSPDIVINCAAYTVVDKAEEQPDAARAINADATAHLARQCAPEIPLLHISTDYVFDGTGNTPYTEDMTPSPLNVYGQTKLEGEQFLQELHPHSIILRTAWVYGPSHANFINTMLQLGRKRKTLSVVDDQRGTPTHAEDIAIALLKIAHEICSGSFDPENYGIYHYTGGGDTTWYDFARTIFDEMHAVTGNELDLSPIPTAAFPTPAKRAAYSILNNDKIGAVFGIEPVPWEGRVRSTVRQILDLEREAS